MIVYNRDVMKLRIKEILERKKLTQRQLAIDSGITEVFINRLCNGRADCTMSVAQKIADALSVSLDELVEKVEAK